MLEYLLYVPDCSAIAQDGNIIMIHEKVLYGGFFLYDMLCQPYKRIIGSSIRFMQVFPMLMGGFLDGLD